MLEKLTIKIEALEAKNEKMKAELESANTQLKNNEMLGGGKSNEELEQNISTLNEMISLL
jgi:phage shock protein A